MICLKIRTFVVSATTCKIIDTLNICCDLLENSYLCGISNNGTGAKLFDNEVVICLKIRTFVVSATTCCRLFGWVHKLWFAWKFVPLWYQQQQKQNKIKLWKCCDLLENSYLCGISNNITSLNEALPPLWFAWKFVPLWYQQQLKWLV